MKTNRQLVSISKDFRWEMGHRLPFHAGACRNIHGHSYRLRVDVDGMPGQNGMVMDYFDLALIMQPFVDELDHCFLCDASDVPMLEFLRLHAMKHVTVPFPTTAENLALWLLGRVADKLRPYPNLKALRVCVCETERTSAQCGMELDKDE